MIHKCKEVDFITYSLSTIQGLSFATHQEIPFQPTTDSSCNTENLFITYSLSAKLFPVY